MDFRIFTEPQQGATYEELLAVALEAERLDFDAFFRSDHFLKMGSVTGLPGPTDAWVTLAGLARDTTRIRLGTLMTAATFRHPGPLAVSVAEVDAMSGGRIEFGFGAGWYVAEHTAYGIPFPQTPKERIDRLEEQLQVILGIWDTPSGEEFSFHGQYFDIEANPSVVTPAQLPHPPILIGGKGPKRTPQIAAKYADEFNVAFNPSKESSEQFGRVRDACESIERDPSSMRMSVAQVLCVGENDADIERRAQSIEQTRADVRETGLYGTVDEVIDKIKVFADAGAERLYLQILDLSDLDHLRLFAERVAPAFK